MSNDSLNPDNLFHFTDKVCLFEIFKTTVKSEKALHKIIGRQIQKIKYYYS